MAGTTTVKVVALGFPYQREIEQEGETRIVHAYGRRGEEIEVNDQDLARGRRLDAFADPDAEDDEAPDAIEADVVDMSDDELDEWFQSQSPTVSDVVEAAGDDPENAQRLLAAENRNTGNDPRSTLVEGLQKIIDGE